MRARVKATGEIVEVQEEYDLRNAMVEEFYSNVENSFDTYEREELDFNIKDDNIPDYWERIKHQAMIAAMQAIITNPIGFEHVRASNQGRCISEDVADIAKGYAADLVSKMKEDIQNENS